MHCIVKQWKAIPFPFLVESICVSVINVCNLLEKIGFHSVFELYEVESISATGAGISEDTDTEFILFLL